MLEISSICGDEEIDQISRDSYQKFRRSFAAGFKKGERTVGPKIENFKPFFSIREFNLKSLLNASALTSQSVRQILLTPELAGSAAFFDEHIWRFELLPFFDDDRALRLELGATMAETLRRNHRSGCPPIEAVAMYIGATANALQVQHPKTFAAYLPSTHEIASTVPSKALVPVIVDVALTIDANKVHKNRSSLFAVAGQVEKRLKCSSHEARVVTQLGARLSAAYWENNHRVPDSPFSRARLFS